MGISRSRVIRAAVIATTITRFQDIKDSEGNYNYYDVEGIAYTYNAALGALRSYKISVTSRTTKTGPAFPPFLPPSRARKTPAEYRAAASRVAEERENKSPFRRVPTNYPNVQKDESKDESSVLSCYQRC